MLRFFVTCVLWYASSAITNNIGKEILLEFKFPVTLTIVQFAFVSLFSALYGALVTRTLKPMTWNIIRTTIPLSCFQILGHIFSSVALTYVTVSFSHTIKALSPVLTISIYWLFFRIVHSQRVYTALLVLTLGVMLVCATNLKFNWAGFFCAFSSTLIFVVQNIFSKRIFTDTSLNVQNSVKMDKLNLLFYSGTMAFVLMLPIWFSAEGLSVLDADRPSIHLIGLFFLNGVTHFSQAIFAFTILSLVSPITYSIASLVKRIFVITASILWFGDLVSLAQGSGIALTFLGLYLYHLAEREVEKGEKKIEEMQRRGSLPRHL
ncbi:suppressor of loss of ypt1 [Kappamyces sp. JEL0829]|nr:suppressor of loss of ypt1 [Kappamyces sp. JEL0829]